jgi:hypothetical protein
MIDDDDDDDDGSSSCCSDALGLAQENERGLISLDQASLEPLERSEAARFFATSEYDCGT